MDEVDALVSFMTFFETAVEVVIGVTVGKGNRVLGRAGVPCSP